MKNEPERSVIATICARGGSKGLPGKNVRSLCGRPLLQYSIEHALATTGINGGVFVSTDDDEIAMLARRCGAEVPYLRPTELASDTAPKVPVIDHLVDWLESSGHRIDVVVDLDPTSPLRLVSDVDAALSLLDDSCDLVLSVCESHKNPYFNMAEEERDGMIQLSKAPPGAVNRRQDAPRVYDVNGSVYVYRREALRRQLWDNRVRPYVMPRERSVDIDGPVDFALVELLMSRRIEDGLDSR